MAKRKKTKENKNYEVVGEKLEALKWDYLKDMALQHKQAVIDINTKLLDLGARYKEEIENDEILKNIYSGMSNTLADITKRLNEAMGLHSKKEDNKLYFYSGEIDANDDKAIEHFMNVMLLYQAIANDLIVFSNTSIVAFTTRLEEVLRSKQPKVEEANNG
jgi:hypothetical protein